MITITTTDVAAQAHGVKLLVHARAGMGKTRLCATAPYPLIISAEAGLLSLREFQLPTIVIRSYAELEDAYRFCALSTESNNYWTVCLDSLSEIGEAVLSKEKKATRDPRKAYGAMQDSLIDLVKGFRDLPGKHVYMSCKQGMKKDEMTGATLWGPLMPGQQVGPALPYLFDEVFSLETARTPEGRLYRYFRTAPDPQYEAKDRSGSLEMFEQPDLNYIFNKILTGGK